MKVKKKKITEKEIVTEEPEREMITEKISIPSEKPEESTGDRDDKKQSEDTEHKGLTEHTARKLEI